MCTIMKGSMDTNAFGWLLPGIPTMPILDFTCYRCRERKGKGKAKGKCLVVTPCG